MGKISYKDIGNYASSENNTNFFTLSNDGDSAIVRILADSIDDVFITPVHENVDVDGVQRKVNCLRKPNGSIDDCPFCKAGMRVSIKMYLELLVYEQDKKGNPTGKYTYEIWERGKKYINKITALSARYASKKPLTDMLFEITRNGEKGDQNTSYEIFPITDTEFYDICTYNEDDLPEPFDPIGKMVMKKDFDEMDYYTKKGKFPKTESREKVEKDKPPFDTEDEEVVEERTSRRVVAEDEEDEQPVRRTRRLG